MDTTISFLCSCERGTSYRGPKWIQFEFYDSSTNGRLLPHKTGCAIEIQNYHQDLELRTPSTYIDYCYAVNSPVSVIRAGTSEACMFRKRYYSATGIVLLLNFDIINNIGLHNVISFFDTIHILYND